MAISALDRAMGMVNGQNSLDQGGLQEVGQQPGKMGAELIKKLLEKLEGSNGAQGGGGQAGRGQHLAHWPASTASASWARVWKW